MRCFVYGFGTYLNFIEDGWTSMYYILDGIARVPVSLFFAEKAWSMLGRNKAFGGVLAFLLLGGLVCCIAAKVSATGFTAESLTTENEALFVVVWLALNVIADLIVTTTLAVRLLRSKTGWSATDRLITKVLFLIGETQLPPTIFEVVFLVLTLTMNDSTIPAFFACTPKIYLLCLMTVLDARVGLRSTLGGSSEHPNTYKSRGKHGGGDIHIKIEVYVHHDNSDPHALPLVSLNRRPLPDTQSPPQAFSPDLTDLSFDAKKEDADASSDKDPWDSATNDLDHELDVVLPQYGSPMGQAESGQAQRLRSGAGGRAGGGEGGGESTVSLALPVYTTEEEERYRKGERWGRP